ncbi:MAG TPA: hypothetical protein VIE63_14400 [Ramlibacter sp.]
MPLLLDVEPVVLPDELLIVPALPVVPVPVELLVLPGVELDVLEPGIVELPLAEPVPVAPIEDVPPEPVVSLLAVPVLPVLGDVEVALPVVVPDVPVLPVVVDGVVADEPVVVLFVPSPRWHALSERAATTARTAVAVWVRVVFIRNSLEMGVWSKGRAAPTALRSL